MFQGHLPEQKYESLADAAVKGKVILTESGAGARLWFTRDSGGQLNRDLAGRCGMYCGACEIYRAYKEAGKLRIDVARKHKCLPAEVKCEGCRAVHIVGWGRDEKWGRNCIILACLKTKGLETCGDCERISACQKLGVLAAEYQPLGMDLKANLRSMHQLGLGPWLDQQDARWRCQSCGAPVFVSSDDTRCHKCGAYQL